jgi:hydrogenase expression/formation protein HypC
MCLAVPGKVVQINGVKAIIEFSNIRREVFVHLVPFVEVGDYVLVHAGCAIHTIDKDEAMKTIEILKELGEDEVC